MKMTTPRLLIILAGLVAVFAIIKVTKNTSRSKSFRTELVAFATEEADKITISTPDQVTNLYKEGEAWKVETEQGVKDALEGSVTSMLNTLNTIEPSRLAARSESKWKDFAVDSSGTRVSVFAGKKSLADIVLGRFGVEGQRSFYTYVRLTEDEDVYVADNFMKMSVSSTPNDFRNNVLMRLNKDSLTSITFNYPDSSLVLSKQDGKWYRGDLPADSAAVAGYLSKLNIVSSRGFVAPSNNLNPDLSVSFGFTDKPEIQISAYKSEEDWIITSTENPEEAWSEQALFDKVFAASGKF